MKRIDELSIDPKTPFEGDDLGREPQAAALLRLVKTVGSSSLVVAIKSPYGSGKSTFLRRLAPYFEANRVPAVSLDLWKQDYMPDPLLAYIGALKKRIEILNGPTKATAGNAISNLAKYGSQICGPIVAALAEEIPAGKTLKAIAKLITEGSKKALDAQKEHEESVEGFRDSLIKARDALTDRAADMEIAPIAFIIDELDRCKPDFAMRALERIKHFFDIEGVVFVIATDDANLPAAVQTVYGIGQDADRYLRKFIDFEFNLPAPPADQFCKYLFKQFSLETLAGSSIDDAARELATRSDQFRENPRHLRYTLAGLREAFPVFAEALKLSLRDQLQAFGAAVAVIRSAPPGFPILPSVLVCCVCVRYVDQPLYDNLRSNHFSLRALIEGGMLSSTNPKAARIGIEKPRTLLSGGLKVIGIKDFQQAARELADVMNSSSFPPAQRTVADQTLEIFQGYKDSLDDYCNKLLAMCEIYGPSIEADV